MRGQLLFEVGKRDFSWNKVMGRWASFTCSRTANKKNKAYQSTTVEHHLIVSKGIRKALWKILLAIFPPFYFVRYKRASSVVPGV